MKTKKYKIGYTQGVFDLFHVGHLNLINNAKKLCEHLVVGVNSDELVLMYKGFTPNISEENRLAIIKNLKAVDEAYIVNTLDKNAIHKQIEFDAIFIGDDWYGNERWIKTEEDLKKIGVEVVFLKRTDGVSSTMLRECRLGGETDVAE